MKKRKKKEEEEEEEKEILLFLRKLVPGLQQCPQGAVSCAACLWVALVLRQVPHPSGRGLRNEAPWGGVRNEFASLVMAHSWDLGAGAHPETTWNER